jgi:hypothetical protein
MEDDLMLFEREAGRHQVAQPTHAPRYVVDKAANPSTELMVVP